MLEMYLPKGIFCIKLKAHVIVACHGRAVKSTGFKLWLLISRVWARIPVVALAIRTMGR